MIDVFVGIALGLYVGIGLCSAALMGIGVVLTGRAEKLWIPVAMVVLWPLPFMWRQ